MRKRRHVEVVSSGVTIDDEVRLDPEHLVQYTRREARHSAEPPGPPPSGLPTGAEKAPSIVRGIELGREPALELTEAAAIRRRAVDQDARDRPQNAGEPEL